LKRGGNEHKPRGMQQLWKWKAARNKHGSNSTITASPHHHEQQPTAERTHTRRANGSFLNSSSVDRWYARISLRARSPGRNRLLFRGSSASPDPLAPPPPACLDAKDFLCTRGQRREREARADAGRLRDKRTVTIAKGSVTSTREMQAYPRTPLPGSGVLPARTLDEHLQAFSAS